MTPRRIASQQRAHVPHSTTGDSRKDALWRCHSHGKAHSGGVTLTEKRTLRVVLTKRRILQVKSISVCKFAIVEFDVAYAAFLSSLWL